ncbi:unnamed protein product [Amoebophrya sp. A25]|nr:unnamed protein product [Amoebophrya sp. A25]|eukprot:GSA25T00000772001.1
MSSVIPGADFGRLTPPPGCRLVAGLCLLGFLLPTEIFSCSPRNLFDYYWFWTPATTTFVHHDLLSLLGGILLGWRRFIRAENEHGTVALVLWLGYVSFVIHGLYCLACRVILEYFNARLLTEPIHGLWPLVCLLFTYDAKTDPFAEVNLWPVPVSILQRSVPAIAVASCWLLHGELPLDVVVAIAVGFFVPELTLSESAHDAIESYLERQQAQPAVMWLRTQEGFCTRNAGFKALPKGGLAPPTQATEFGFAGSADLEDPGSSSSSSSADGFGGAGDQIVGYANAASSAVLGAVSSVVGEAAFGGATSVLDFTSSGNATSSSGAGMSGASNATGGVAGVAVPSPVANRGGLHGVGISQPGDNASQQLQAGAFADAEFLDDPRSRTDFLNPAPNRNVNEFLTPSATVKSGDPFLAQHPVFDENINSKDIFGDLGTSDNPFDL